LLQASVETPTLGGVDVAELEQIRGERPVTEAEMELAKAALTRGYARNFETSDQLARALAQLVVHRLPDDYYDRLPDRVREVEAENSRRSK
jgi:predicted Zn-dependent peptidase